MLPSELKTKFPRVSLFADTTEIPRRKGDLDELEEKRDLASVRATKYQQGLRRYYERHVKKRTLEVGDLVL
jgi:hypothetical protein